MHASARYTNVERSLMAHLQGLGVNVIPEDAVRADSDSADDFVRVSLEPGPEVASGAAATGYHAARVPLQVRCQCWARGADGIIGATDKATQLADVVSDALRLAQFPILDYLADPTGATSSGERLQSSSYPSRLPLPPSDGWARRLVVAPFFWFLRTVEA